jgi:hypothetical protein
MLDQASLKLLLRSRADLIAAMLLIRERIRQKQALSLAPLPPAVTHEEAPRVPIRTMIASAGT